MTSSELTLINLNFEQAYDLSCGLIDSLDIHSETAYDYKNRVKQFLSFIDRNDFNRHTLIEFKKYLASRNDFSVSTKNKYLVVARILLQTMVKENLLPVNFPTDIKSFKQSIRHRKYGLTEKEVKTLSEWTNHLEGNSKALRIRAILSLLVMQGLRQIEVTRLNVEDFDKENQVLRVQGKGSDSKEPIPLLPQVVDILTVYLKVTKIKSGPMFYSLSNNSKRRRLTTKSIRILVKEIFEKLEIKRTTHGCRHYFVTRLIKNYQGNLVQVSQLTRHKTLSMLQVYYDTLEQEENKPKFVASFADINL